MAEILKYKNNYNDDLINNYFAFNNDKYYEKIYLLNELNKSFITKELDDKGYSIAIITDLTAIQLKSHLNLLHSFNISIIDNQTTKFVAMKYVNSSDIIMLVTNDYTKQLELIENNNLKETLLNYRKIIISCGFSLKLLEKIIILPDGFFIDKKYLANSLNGLPLDYYLVLDKYGMVNYMTLK